MNESLQNKIDIFRETPSQKAKIIIIYGPTGCGKTGLSIDMATYLHTEIISCDARQIYRGLDIGTGKVTATEMRGIPHHLLDVIDIDTTYSVVDYRDRAESIITSLHDT
jgi:tRNA dimethylallyltransferase